MLYFCWYIIFYVNLQVLCFYVFMILSKLISMFLVEKLVFKSQISTFSAYVHSQEIRGCDYPCVSLFLAEKNQVVGPTRHVKPSHGPVEPSHGPVEGPI